MDTRLVATAIDLRHAEERLLRIGLVVDPSVLSREHRRALAALRRFEDSQPKPVAEPVIPARVHIGFAYPNAR